MHENKTKISKKKKAKLAAKRRRERRERLNKMIQNIAMLAFVFACLGMVIGMPIYKTHHKSDISNWYVKGGAVQIAAPPVANGYMAVNAGYTAVNSGNAAGYTTMQARPERNAMATLPMVSPTPVVKATATPVPTVQPTPTPVPAMPAPAAEATVEPGPTTITITAVGDCTLGGDFNTGGESRFDKYVRKYGYDYFLQNVRSVFEEDDLTIVNLEGTLTTRRNKREGRTFNFRGKPEYAKILSGSSVEVCTMANNHAYDFGEKGLIDTAKAVAAEGMGFSGYDKVFTTTIKGVRVSSIALTQWDYSKSDVKRRVSAAKKNCDLLIVSFHWGEERNYKATSTQKSLGHAAIDAGADLVIGHHPHVFGGVEEYKGKYIAYSLGNFCFGGNGNPSDKRCLIFQQTFEVTADGRIVNAGIDIIPASVSGKSDTNNFQPVIMGESKGKKLLQKVSEYSNLAASTTLWKENGYMNLLGFGASDEEETIENAEEAVEEEPLEV